MAKRLWSGPSKTGARMCNSSPDDRAARARQSFEPCGEITIFPTAGGGGDDGDDGGTTDPAFDPGKVEFTNCTVDAQSVAQDGSVGVTAVVQNGNTDRATSVTVAWTAGGTAVAERGPVPVPSGTQITVSESIGWDTLRQAAGGAGDVQIDAQFQTKEQF